MQRVKKGTNSTWAIELMVRVSEMRFLARVQSGRRKSVRKRSCSERVLGRIRGRER